MASDTNPHTNTTFNSKATLNVPTLAFKRQAIDYDGAVGHVIIIAHGPAFIAHGYPHVQQHVLVLHYEQADILWVKLQTGGDAVIEAFAAIASDTSIELER